jgi:predicted permease
MSWLSRLAALFRKRKLDADLDDEIRFHLEMEEQQNIRAGMPPDEARRQARLRLGGLEQVKESYRDRRGIALVESVFRDLGFALRSFGKDRGWTATVLVTLTLGIGVSTATFSVVNAVLLNPLPYKDPDRVVMLWAVNDEAGLTLEHQRQRIGSLSPVELEDWKERSGLFEKLAWFFPFSAKFNAEGDELAAFGYGVSEGLFRVLGVQPQLGRFFLPEEHDREHVDSSEQPIVLLHAFWQSKFHGNPEVVGKRLHAGNLTYTVVGVAPPKFTFFTRNVQVLTPDNWGALSRTWRNLRAVGLLRVDLPLELAQRRADGFSQHLAEQYPDSNKGWRLTIVPVLEESAGRFRPALLVLFGAVGFVLLAMSFNIVNLFLVRAVTRTKEIAVRNAIGAGRGRLIRQLLTESLLISVSGAMLGLALAEGLVHYLRMLLPGRNVGWARTVLQLDAIQVDATVALFACAAGILAGLVFGAYPALTATKPDLTAALKDLAQGLGLGTTGRNRSRSLVVAQVAVAVVLVFGTGLLVRSVIRLYREGPGFRSGGLVALDIRMPRRQYRQIQTDARAAGLTREDWQQMVRVAGASFRGRMLETLSSVPGVQSVTVSEDSPLTLEHYMYELTLEGRPEAAPVAAVTTWVEPNYFETLGIPIVKGRAFGPHDRPHSTSVAVVSEEMATRAWPGEDPVGKRLRHPPVPNGGPEVQTVVGVVGDTRPEGLGTEPLPVVYTPAAQGHGTGGTFLVRTAGDPALFAPALRQALLRDNPANPVDLTQISMVSNLVRDSAWQVNFATLLLGGLGSLSLLLAAVGLYSVLSYSVRGSTREIGIRLALGATAADIHRRVVNRGVALVAVGLVPGLLLAAGLMRYLDSLLYGVEPLDGTTMAVVVVTFLLAGLAASYLPARRAAKVDPMTALRCE